MQILTLQPSVIQGEGHCSGLRNSLHCASLLSSHLEKTIGHRGAFIQALPTATRRATEGHTMTDTRIANIELIAEIEELENKIAPSGCATLGDL